MIRYLLLISLGPVQDFIHSARRCQDLWYGSTLLSKLAYDVAKALGDGQCSLVFPAKLGQDDREPVANKIQVIVEQGDPAKVAERARKVMQDSLMDYARKAFKRFEGDPLVYLDRAYKQVEEMMELDWVSVELRDNYGGEDGARALAERMLAARKNTRTWSVGLTGLAGVPKSSLDGQRESVLDEELYHRVAAWKKDASTGISSQQLRTKYGVKSAERLCGVGLLKRLGSEAHLSKHNDSSPLFHSTSHVATGPWRAALSRASVQAEARLGEYFEALKAAGVDLDRFRIREQNDDKEQSLSWAADERRTISALTRSVVPWRNGHYDGYLLYEGRLEDIFEQYCDREQPLQKSELIKAVRHELHKVHREVGTPGAYYALLLADGDSMGVALSDLEKHGDAIEAHKRFAEHVTDFSRGCREIVEHHAGSLIFAGGDDVLALLPLHTALACARALHDSFDKEMAKVDGLEKRPTLSVGLGIAHHMDDMAEACDLAKRAEKLAKQFKREGADEPTKNALGIVVSKRSGGDLEIVDTWQGADALDARLLDWCRMMHDELISSKTAFDLETLVAPFFIEGPTSRAADSELQAVVGSLAKGLIDRKRRSGGAEKDAADGEKLVNRIKGKDLRQKIRQLSSELQVARLFTEAYELAFPETTR